jgi:hypothetical protein
MLIVMNHNDDIPDFPASRPLELVDKPLLDRIFSTLQPRISEFTFAGLYLFRKPHGYRLTMVNDSLVILGRGYDNTPHFLPPLSGNVSKSLNSLFSQGLSLYGADEAFRETYLADDLLHIVEDRDSFDYLYLRSDLAELAGNRFHKKKNRVNYFVSRHKYRVELFEGSHADGCIQLLDEWRRVRGETGSFTLDLESEAAAEALSLAGLLGLEGVVVFVEGRIKAFVLGERLNATTSVCHFEKADPFMEGLSQLVDREFNRILFSDCIWVNREQDLGEPGLRAAKLSYHPVEMVKKFSAFRPL